MDALLDGRVKLRHLQCFLAVAHQRSLQKAAAALSVSQPAVSKTLKELEEALGVRLFERGRKATVPTPHAEVFLRHAGASVSALRHGLDALAASVAHGAQARLVVGALPTVAPALLPRAVASWRLQAPGASLRVVTGSNAQLLAQLRAGEADCVIGRLSDPERLAGLTFEHLYAEPFALAVRPGHPLLAVGAPVAGDLRTYPAILPERGTAIRHAADSWLTAAGVGPLVELVETLSVSLGRAMAAASDAVWFVPPGAIEDELAAGTLARLKLETGGSEESVGLLLRSDAVPGPALSALLAALRAAGAARRAQGGQRPPKARPTAQRPTK